MKLNIVFAVDNNGFDMMATALYSVIKNNQKHTLDFYVFHKDIMSSNIARLKKLERVYPNVKIRTPRIDEKRFEKVTVNNVNVTTEAYFRYLAPELLPKNETRALYMDFDMLCIEDLTSLYAADFEGNYLGAVVDYVVESSSSFYGYKDGIGFSKDEKYFNSGLLLLNLDALRKTGLMREFWSNVRNKHKIIPKELNFFADQTVMNLTFKNRIKTLDPRYNTFTTTLEETRQKNPAIIHFTGTYKPMTYRNECTTPYDNMYYEYYKEYLAIAGDDNGHLIKGILKKQSREINSTADVIASKNLKIEELNAHIYDIEDRLHAQDRLIRAQSGTLEHQAKQLGSILVSQRRVVGLMLRRFRGLIGGGGS